MSTLNFPQNPQVDDEYPFAGKTWYWTGFAWKLREQERLPSLEISEPGGIEVPISSLVVPAGSLSVVGDEASINLVNETQLTTALAPYLTAILASDTYMPRTGGAFSGNVFLPNVFSLGGSSTPGVLRNGIRQLGNDWLDIVCFGNSRARFRHGNTLQLAPDSGIDWMSSHDFANATLLAAIRPNLTATETRAAGGLRVCNNDGSAFTPVQCGAITSSGAVDGTSIRVNGNQILGQLTHLSRLGADVASAGGFSVVRIGGTFQSPNTLICIGGLSSGHPALRRSNADLDVRLADDSNWANLNTGNITASGTGTFGGSTLTFGGLGLVSYSAITLGCSANVQIASNRSFGFSTGAIGNNNSANLSLASAGVVQIGTTSNNALGSLNLANITASGTVQCGALTASGNVGINPAANGLVGTIGFTNGSINLMPSTILRWQSSFGAPFTDSNSDLGLRRLSSGVLQIVAGDGTTARDLDLRNLTASGTVTANSISATAATSTLGSCNFTGQIRLQGAANTRLAQGGNDGDLSILRNDAVTPGQLTVGNLTASGSVDVERIRQTGNTSQQIVPSGGIWFLDCTGGIRMRDPGSGFASRFQIDNAGNLTASGTVTANSLGPHVFGTGNTFQISGGHFLQVTSGGTYGWVTGTNLHSTTNGGLNIRNGANTVLVSTDASGNITASGNVDLTTNSSSFIAGRNTNNVFVRVQNGDVECFTANNRVVTIGDNSQGMRLAADRVVTWTDSNTNAFGSRSLTLSQASAGVLQVGTSASNALGSLNLANITASGTLTAPMLSSPRAGSLGSVNPANQIVISGGFAGHGVGFSNNGELATVVNFERRSELGLHLNIGSIGSVRANSAGNLSGTYDVSFSRAGVGVWQMGTTGNNALGSLNLTNLTASGTINTTSIYTINPAAQTLVQVAFAHSFRMGANEIPRVEIHPTNGLGIGVNASGMAQGVWLKDQSGLLDIRNNAGAFASVQCGNITASGSITSNSGNSRIHRLGVGAGTPDLSFIRLHVIDFDSEVVGLYVQNTADVSSGTSRIAIGHGGPTAFGVAAWQNRSFIEAQGANGLVIGGAGVGSQPIRLYSSRANWNTGLTLTAGERVLIGTATDDGVSRLQVAGLASIPLGISCNASNALSRDLVYFNSNFNIGNNAVVVARYGGADGGRALSVVDSAFNDGGLSITKTTGAAAANANVCGLNLTATYSHSDAGGAGHVGIGARIAATNNTASSGTLFGATISAAASTANSVGLRVSATSTSGIPVAIESLGNVTIAGNLRIDRATNNIDLRTNAGAQFALITNDLTASLCFFSATGWPVVISNTPTLRIRHGSNVGDIRLSGPELFELRQSTIAAASGSLIDLGLRNLTASGTVNTPTVELQHWRIRNSAEVNGALAVQNIAGGWEGLRVNGQGLTTVRDNLVINSRVSNEAGILFQQSGVTQWQLYDAAGILRLWDASLNREVLTINGSTGNAIFSNNVTAASFASGPAAFLEASGAMSCRTSGSTSDAYFGNSNPTATNAVVYLQQAGLNRLVLGTNSRVAIGPGNQLTSSNFSVHLNGAHNGYGGLLITGTATSPGDLIRAEDNSNVARFTVSATGNITASGHITSAFQTLPGPPSTIDIPNGFHRLVKDNSTLEIRDWVNDGGIMRRSPAYT